MEKYDTIVNILEETKDISTLSVTELVGSLEAYEKRINRKNKEISLENGFERKLNLRSQKSQDGGRNSKREETSRSGATNTYRRNESYPPCRCYKKANHAGKDCWHKQMPQCIICKRFGHLEKDC
ncbi:hypothetical protein LIER_14090 [Lithospermum erythrorhizon]|uniref:CCHC-type domain-containing protein n=1 Tax=Lithospermum erythrorhizon TaxID=34254 RepID=A0AAV3PZF1_LITER